MAKPLLIEVNGYEAGLINGRTQRLLPPDGASSNEGCDYTAGSIVGLYGPGDAVTTVAAGSRFVHLKDGVGWRASAYKNHACLDSPRIMGSTLTGISYYTNVDAGGAHQPLVSAGSDWADKVLGLAVNTITSITAGTAGVRAYRVTREVFIDNLGASWESNPSATFTTTNAINCTLNFAAAGVNSTGITYRTNIYATQAGQTTGPFYYIDSAAPGATSYSDPNNAFGVPTRLLNWDNGGSPQGALYKYDHGTSPALYVLANALMGVPATPAVTGGSLAAYSHARAGILFGASYATLYWSATGYPWYWPSLNAEELDDIIEAIVVDRAIAYVFTRSSIYTITGTDATNLTITKTGARHGCYPQAGPTVQQTPYGIFYRCQQGIAVFDGGTSRVVTDGILLPGFDTTGVVLQGAYQDGVYVVAGDAHGYAVSLAAWPKAVITQLDAAHNYQAMAPVQPHATGGVDANSLYVYDASDNGVKPWSPRQGGHNATRYSWQHITGAYDAGEPNKKKRFMRFWPAKTGNIQYDLFCFLWDGTQVATITLTGESWLPSTFTGDYLIMAISALDATAIQRGFRVEAEAYV